jgi:preprotein translocase subunit SecG
MYQLIIIVHVLLGLGVIGLILMQQGKGADAGAAFAGGGSGSVFGAQGAASFLSRTTAILAALFFTTSLGLAVLSGYENKPDDLMEQPEIEQPLADVPLVDENKPTTDSIPVVSPAEKEIIVPDPIIDAPIEAITDTIIDKPQQVDDTIVPETKSPEVDVIVPESIADVVTKESTAKQP